MPSVEQTREFKVLTGVFSAEFGRGAGVVSVSTKSGANQLHGTAFEYLRNDAFDARNFFVRKTMQTDGTLLKDPVPPLDRHQFGGALGGALVLPGLYDGHSRTFFFADYSGIRERRGVTTVNTVPTAATRIGDFSDYRDRNGNLIPIYDPLTTRLDGQGRVIRDQFPNNIIPSNWISPVGLNIASVYPLPNTGTGSFDNYISTPDREIRDNAFSGRVDHRFSDKDTFFVRFNYGRFRLDAPQGQANCCLPTPAEAAARFDLGPFVAGIQNTKLTTHGAAFNYSRVMQAAARQRAARRLREYGAVHDAVRLRPSVRRIARHSRHQHQPDHDGPAQHRHHELHRALRRPGVPARQSQPVALPDRRRARLAQRSAPAEGRVRLVDRYPSPFIHDNTRSAINFNTSFVNNPLTNTGGTGLAEVLVGYFNSASRGFLSEPPTFHVMEQAAFLQDDFKVNNRFTINAGLRYEIFHAPPQKENRLANFDYQSFRLVYAEKTA